LPMDEVPRLIESGQIDIGVVRLPIKHPRSIHSHILLQDHFCLALQSGHRLAEPNRQINAAELGPVDKVDSQIS
jgi:DNA-binding transcriptional LysR family regulator